MMNRLPVMIFNLLVILTFTSFNFLLAWSVHESQELISSFSPIYYYLVVSAWMMYVLSLVRKFLEED